MRKCVRQFTLGLKHLYDSETLKLIHVNVYYVESFSYHSIGWVRLRKCKLCIPRSHLLCASPLPFYVLLHSHLLCATPLPFIMCFPVPIHYVLPHSRLLCILSDIFIPFIPFYPFILLSFILILSNEIFVCLTYCLNGLLSSGHICKCLLLPCTYF